MCDGRHTSHAQRYWLGNEPVTFYARENREEIWVERSDSSLLLVYERGLATSEPVCQR